jgi:hypothetical protein
MIKNYLLSFAMLFGAVSVYGQNNATPTIEEVTGLPSNPNLIPSTQAYITCGYEQAGNNLENGRAITAPGYCGENFTIQGNTCWDVSDINIPLFVPAGGPSDVGDITLHILDDNNGNPGTSLHSYTATAADWTTTLKGSAFGFDIYDFNINLPTTFNLCGTGSGTTYWLAASATNLGAGNIFWEFATTTPYGNSGVSSTVGVNGPWTSPGDNFVFKVTGDVTTVDEVNACGPYTWVDGVTYTSNNNTATFTVPAGNPYVCDSNLTLDLTIGSPNTGIDEVIGCDSYTWIDGNTYTTDNNSATFTLTNVAGCDSVVTLDLTMSSSTTGTDVVTACDSFTWINSVTYTVSNNSAVFTIPSATGCDSTVTLDLFVGSVNPSIINNNGTLSSLAAPATFQWVDCDDNFSPIEGATDNVFVPTSNGNYAVIINQYGCIDTTNCQTVTNASLSQNLLNEAISLFPNPTSDKVQLESDLLMENITVRSITGQLISSQEVNSNSFAINLEEQAKGVYMISVTTDKGIANLRVIKE